MKQAGALILCLPEPMKICSGQATELCSVGHNASREKLHSSLLQDFSLPPAQKEIGYTNYLKTKLLSPQISIS